MHMGTPVFARRFRPSACLQPYAWHSLCTASCAIKRPLSFVTSFRFEPDWARVISGVDEGIYGWMALNYLTGHLTSDVGKHDQAGTPHPAQVASLHFTSLVLCCAVLCCAVLCCRTLVTAHLLHTYD